MLNGIIFFLFVSSFIRAIIRIIFLFTEEKTWPGGSIMKFRHKALTIKKEIFLMSFAFLATVSLVFSGVFLHILYRKNMENAGNSLRECNAQIVIYTEGMFHENESIVNILSRADTIVDGGSGNPAAVLKIYDAILKDNSNITYIYSGYATEDFISITMTFLIIMIPQTGHGIRQPSLRMGLPGSFMRTPPTGNGCSARARSWWMTREMWWEPCRWTAPMN